MVWWWRRTKPTKSDCSQLAATPAGTEEKISPVGSTLGGLEQDDDERKLVILSHCHTMFLL